MHPDHPRPAARPLCTLAALRDPDARGFTVPGPGGEVAVVLVRCGAVVRAYLNRCPHTGVGLEWVPDRFLDPSGRFLQCATHGALFRIEDGRCVAGPCTGDRLEPLAVEVVDGEIRVHPPPGAGLSAARARPACRRGRQDGP